MSGALSALAFAPHLLTPLSAVGFAVLGLLLASSPARRAAFLEGWLFGLGHFLVGLAWIVESFQFADSELVPFAWPAVFALCAFLSIFPASAVFLARCVGPGLPALIALPASWTITEMARGALFTGFPWNLVSYIWAASDETMQAAAIFGAYGLSLITLCFFVLPVILLLKSSTAPRILLAATIVGFGSTLLWGYGAFRLHGIDEPETAGPTLRIVQGNIAQDRKWEASSARSIFDLYISLSTSTPTSPGTIVVWPETALPTNFIDRPAVTDPLSKAVPMGGALVFGAVRAYPEDGSVTALRNSLIVIDQQGEVLTSYDKRRLVPFGEYMPLKWLLPLRKMTDGAVDFEPGTGAGTLKVPGLPTVAALICYEAIFPGGRYEETAGLFLNATNDAWFGTSAGPYQHFVASRFRAVEAGIPLVRAANSGISAIVDSYGRVVKSLPLNVTGVLDGRLPKASISVMAPNLQSGLLYLAMATLVVSALALSVTERRRRRLGLAV